LPKSLRARIPQGLALFGERITCARECVGGVAQINHGLHDLCHDRSVGIVQVGGEGLGLAQRQRAKLRRSRCPRSAFQ
jgi:hypothetical protein